MLGESQRGVARLFERTLPDLARRGRRTLVLLDEVESLAVSRTGASLEANPVEAHRATDAVLAGIDLVARTCPNVVFVATTNHAAGVDIAFLSRADLVEQVGLPGPDALARILRDTMGELVPADRIDDQALRAVAAACADRGIDARPVRQLPLPAACSTREPAIAPGRLTGARVPAALPGQ